MARLGYRLGIDIGGTFTDFTVLETGAGTVFNLKVPTVTSDPAQGVVDGLARLAEQGVQPEEIDYFVHGTTTALNALLQRSGARVALLVTAGFRDLLTLQRLRLPVPYDFRSRFDPPLVPREHVFPVRERLRADGSVLRPLDAGSLDAALDGALAAGVEGIAVCFLHSYRNGEHERLAAARIRERAPELAVCLSSDLWPQMREYERAVVTVANLFVRPSTHRYLSGLVDTLHGLGVPATPLITQSNGGVTTLDRAATAPVFTLLSGPAAGIVGACRVGAQAGLAQMITFDMGGTSTDISIVEDGAPWYTSNTRLGGLPLMLPAVDVASIGAGGGSVVWIDAGGLLKVGPQSVGSHPGPACYGRGGQAALTDAFLAAGYLNAERFAGGRVALFPEQAMAALRPVADRLGLGGPEAADRVIQVAVANMFAELSNVMERRGFDPREFSLVAYGGAGPLTASFLADEIQAEGVLVPLSPGTLCSLGALAADLVHDVVRVWPAGLDPTPTADWRRGFAELAEEARGWLAAQDLADLPEVRLRYSMDLRYSGQAFEIEIPLDPAWIEALNAGAIRDAFHRQHQRQYAHCDREAEVEVVSLRVRLVGSTPQPPAVEMAEGTGAAPLRGERTVHYRGSAHAAGVYARSDLRPGHRIAGPAIVEQDDTTVLVLAGWHAEVDRWGNLYLGRHGG